MASLGGHGAHLGSTPGQRDVPALSSLDVGSAISRSTRRCERTPCEPGRLAFGGHLIAPSKIETRLLGSLALILKQEWQDKNLRWVLIIISLNQFTLFIRRRRRPVICQQFAVR